MTEALVYVCDLDGTLLGPDAKLSDFSRRGLALLLGAGVPLTIASARGTPAMRALLAGVPLELPVIELNGAFVSDLDDGRHLAGKTLSAVEACAAVAAILETGVAQLLLLGTAAATASTSAPEETSPRTGTWRRSGPTATPA